MTIKAVSHPVRLSDNGVLLLLAACGTLIHVLPNGQYGFRRDELDILWPVESDNRGPQTPRGLIHPGE